LSPDERRVALTIIGANETGWVLDLERQTMNRFTFVEGDVRHPMWSPDSARIVFGSTGRRALLSVNMDAPGDEEVLHETGNDPLPQSWSPDGTTMLFQENHPDTGYDLWLLPMTLDAEPQPLAQTSFLEREARFSSDGRLVAYSSDESGQPEVYVQPYPGPGRRLRISVDGGRMPRWRGDGRELFFISGTQMMAVPVGDAAIFEAGTPRVLFSDDNLTPFEAWGYDVTEDGQSFLMTYAAPEAPSTEFIVVQNWFSELERLAPTP
jgi:Tol biopolymer transport system component